MAAVADILTGMVVDVSDLLYKATVNGELVMFEGAQGTLLDIDHGTYPYVTSLKHPAGGVATGSGFRSALCGLCSGYHQLTPPAWVPVRSTELFDETGEYPAYQRPSSVRPPGRAPSLRLAGHHCYPPRYWINSCRGSALTKLDVLDGLKEVKVCRLPFTEW